MGFTGGMSPQNCGAEWAPTDLTGFLRVHLVGLKSLYSAMFGYGSRKFELYFSNILPPVFKLTYLLKIDGFFKMKCSSIYCGPFSGSHSFIFGGWCWCKPWKSKSHSLALKTCMKLRLFQVPLQIPHTLPCWNTAQLAVQQSSQCQICQIWSSAVKRCKK